MGLSIYHEKLSKILKEERKVALTLGKPMDEASHMTSFINSILGEVKSTIASTGFKSKESEIQFFKNIKPQILGRLIYYNKVYKLETSCPAKDGKMYLDYYSKELKNLKEEHKRHMQNTKGFYQYYRSSREDLDHLYFLRGNINLSDGLNSFVFEVDPMLSTYYDYKAAKIVGVELLNGYLISKLEIVHSETTFKKKLNGEEIKWTASKNALIELIYALHISGNISHGKAGIKKIASMFQAVFGINLGDIHHAFHRMKERTGSRTSFLDHLKESVEEFMDNKL